MFTGSLRDELDRFFEREGIVSLRYPRHRVPEWLVLGKTYFVKVGGMELWNKVWWTASRESVLDNAGQAVL